MTAPLVSYFPSGPFATNAILLACPATQRAAIVDPAAGSLRVLESAIGQHELVVEKILLTHSHWDHIVDTAAAKERFNVPVWVHKEDAANLLKPGTDGVPIFLEGGIKGVKADHYLEDGMVVEVGELSLEVLHTPGHCPGLVCFYLEREGLLISGDLLFRGTMGTLAVPTAEPEKMWASLERISALPPTTRVYPGHGEPTTIGDEGWLSHARELFGY